MKVRDCMSKNVITVGLNTPLRELAKILFEKNINGVPVVDSENKVIGVKTAKGITVKTDFVIISAGVKPNIE